MQTLLLVGAVGFVAQVINGSLGMGYGVTTSSFLLAMGLAPAAASATVHLAKIGSALTSGFAHWRFGNVDWSVVAKVGIPGAVGAFIGATVLARLPIAAARPVMSLVLLLLGLYLLARFTLRNVPKPVAGNRPGVRFLVPLGLVGGVLDATGGGGWGPVGTPALIAGGRMEPRRVVGSVDTAEFLVGVGATLGFALSLDHQEVNLGWVGALLVAALFAAPLGAWLVSKFPSQVLGAGVGGLLVFTNVYGLLTLVSWGYLEAALIGAVLVLWGVAIAHTVRVHRRKARNAGDVRTPEAEPVCAE
ncbi:sulfite exporter TauE/SafE family protein [Salininema proteolyticum]|uniref:Probable membrane transporter protein n=1 Tax=Salininema proteolyticum TaxID=1607685 RepID=A0ABV8TZ85_9ACTN